MSTEYTFVTDVVALNPVHTTANYCHKLKVTECPGLRIFLEKHSLQFKMDLAHHEQFVVMSNTTFKTSLLNTFEVQGLNQLILLNGVPILKFCNTFGLLLWLSLHLHSHCVIANSLGSSGSLTSSLNHGCCSKPSQQFIIPTHFGFVSFTLFCKRMILVLLF